MRKPDYVYRAALKILWLLDGKTEVKLVSVAFFAHDKVTLTLVDRNWKYYEIDDRDARHRLKKIGALVVDKQKAKAKKEAIESFQLGF